MEEEREVQPAVKKAPSRARGEKKQAEVKPKPARTESNMRKKRIAAGFTQAQVAKAFGKSPAWYSGVERAGMSCSPRQDRMLAHMFGCSRNDFWPAGPAKSDPASAPPKRRLKRANTTKKKPFAEQ